MQNDKDKDKGGSNEDLLKELRESRQKLKELQEKAQKIKEKMKEGSKE